MLGIDHEVKKRSALTILGQFKFKLWTFFDSSIISYYNSII